MTPLFGLVYALSGAAALVYEVVWLRWLGLAFGHSSGAVGTVLAAFMGGLAIGAWLAGRRIDGCSAPRALRVYVALELAVAGIALVLPFAVDAAHPLLAWAYANGQRTALFDSVRLVLSLTLIAVPAAAMGASFPVAVQAAALAARDAVSARRQAGRLYAMNTLGATFGAGAAGFLLLPALGLFRTTLVGVALNVIAAGVAWRLSRSVTTSVGPPPAPSARQPTPPQSQRDRGTDVGLAASAALVSGLAGLIYEVSWTRILAMLLGPTTYAFSAMLVAFIGGLAIGSAAGAAIAGRTRSPGVALAAALLATGAGALGASAAIDRLPMIIAAAAGRPDASFTSMFALQVLIAIVMQLPMTIALGAAFPLSMAVASSADHPSRGAALVYAANTAGAIAGALGGTFILVPLVGLERSIQIAAVAGLVMAGVLGWRATSSRRARGGLAVVATATVAGIVLTPPWNHERLVNGAYRFAPALVAGDVENGLDAGRLLFYQEGPTGTVSVKELVGVRGLAIDGKVDASNGADMLTQKLLAHLPLLLHPNPHSVYIIGLGSGVTLGAALRHPIEHAVISELSPAVVTASALFDRENRAALHDPRVRLIIGDGRAHLLLTDERYDVIVSEPSNPWMAGVSTLFTREFFTAARSRLQPGGILCQWAHTYNISDDDLRSIVATFTSVFPEGTAWLVGESDLLLIGSPAPLGALDDGLLRAWQRPGIADDLRAAHVQDPFSVLMSFIGQGQDLRDYSRGAAIQTDDRLQLEFSAPRALYGRFERGNVDRLHQVAARAAVPAAVAQARAAATPLQWRHRAEMEMAAGLPDSAYLDFQTAAAQSADDETLQGLVRAAVAADRLPQAEAFLRARADATGSTPVLTALSRVLAVRGQLQEAAVIAQRAASHDPASVTAMQQLIAALSDSANDPALEQLAALLARAGESSPLTLRAQMRLAYLRHDFASAAQLAGRLLPSIADLGDRARTLNLQGSAYAAHGDRDRARAAFESSLAAEPSDPTVLANLGNIELQSGRTEAAAERFSEALFIYPRFAPALEGLAQVFDEQGATGRAAAIRRVGGIGKE